jgi:hypothetical protein
VEYYKSQNRKCHFGLNTTLNSGGYQDTDSALKSLPILVELDNEATLSELKDAFLCQAKEKAPGNETIPAEILKCLNEQQIKELHEILCLCWKEGSVPQDLCVAYIVTLYKNKGDHSDCNNYCGISLMSIIGKPILTTA